MKGFIASAILTIIAIPIFIIISGQPLITQDIVMIAVICSAIGTLVEFLPQIRKGE